MRDKINRVTGKIIKILSSNYFFWFIIFLFVFQALWIALSFRYSMIYDEYYYFGLIEYFSHQWLPWINNQPTSLDLYGALDRNPYLLFHYLLSFPFRVVALFTDNLAAQVISMRILNIGLFAAGLVAFNRLFKEMKIRAIFRNITLLFFVLLPVTPFVAATVNYDNAIFLLTALFMIVGLRIIQSDVVRWQNYALILIIGMAGSLTKVVFLPIFAAGFVFIAINQILKYKKKIINNTKKSFTSSGKLMKIAIIVPLIVVGFLFAERFAVNIIQYRSLSPSCETQIGDNRCGTNSINARGDALVKSKAGKIPMQQPEYAAKWVSDMLFYAMWSGNMTSSNEIKFTHPLPVVYNVVFWLSIVSVAAFFYSLNRIRNLPGFWFLSSITAIYIAALFYENISAYYRYYQAVAIQGRYLLPLLPVIMLFGLIGINYIIKQQRVIKITVLVFVFLLFLNGAGLTTHLIRSDESWNWDSQTIRQINNNSRKVLAPFISEWWYER